MRKSDRYRKLEDRFRKLAETSPRDRDKFICHAEGWRYLADTSDFIAAQKSEIQTKIDAIVHSELSTKHLVTGKMSKDRVA